MSNTVNDEARSKLLNERKRVLSDFIGKPYENIVDRFTCDLLGCLSGGSNERQQAREWLLFCFHQYFGSGDFDKDNDRLEELRALLESFSEPTTIL